MLAWGWGIGSFGKISELRGRGVARTQAMGRGVGGSGSKARGWVDRIGWDWSHGTRYSNLASLQLHPPTPTVVSIAFRGNNSELLF